LPRHGQSLAPENRSI